ncbi:MULTISPECIES: O-antigen ligase family protein [unclassified Facklamia]|uniref:O-antigen ligase family protein n=1 Tax=Aerococcaceae TaxID=186827 RepID=UPI0013B9D729|nr:MULTISPECIES: O-antigen ligase family protein [unclassified Facklamia]NEW63600.1 O-antigen ligase domain-containing protein [Facklamia sp. 252]NEW67071.1 O-antigen ligase domain-containing protein [Facklamia sp. 253]QQD66383.1 O-antigen ligase family protein [Aerococcaceae bacterium zg-252]
MFYYLLMLVMSVFLGTKLFAIPTPVAQLTLYRLLVFMVPLILAQQYFRKQDSVKLLAKSDATRAWLMYLFWWFIGVVSVIWVKDIKLWFQAVFLLSIGVFVITALYLWLNKLEDWYRIIYGVWVMMCFQILWGYYEIITGNYLFADLAKLDKYRTFNSQPMTRIPITYFANQNDYATFLLASLSIMLICYHRAQNIWLRLTILLSGVASSYLIYRSGSRMALLMLGVFIILLVLFQFKITFNRKIITTGLITGIVGLITIFIIKPALWHKLLTMLLSTQSGAITGDSARVNLYKNGLIFIGETFGRGVGAGNVEYWMGNFTYYSVGSLVNIHNWWLEILVGYGIFVFASYLVVYILLIRRLFIMTKYSSQREQYTARALLIFMLIFIFSSITSASNMLIEWHWCIFALLISYIKIHESINRNRV